MAAWPGPAAGGGPWPGDPGGGGGAGLGPAQLQVGRIQLRLERFAALASCERAVALDPELAAAHFNRGYALLSWGPCGGRWRLPAGVSLDAALAADAYVDMAVAHHKQGERAAALTALKEPWT